MTQPPPPPEGQPLHPSDPAKKSGLSPWAWVAIGCGVIVLVGGLALTALGIFVGGKAKQMVQDFEENPEMSAAKMIVRMDPDLEVVESDERAGTLTIRNSDTGEVHTFDVSEVREGRITFSDEEGERTEIGIESGREAEEGRVRVTGPGGEVAEWGGEGRLPGWLPRYPGARVQQLFRTQRGEQVTASYLLETDASFDEAVAFYEEALEEAGIEVTRTDVSQGRERSAMLSGSDGGREATVSFQQTGTGTNVTILFSQEER